MGRYEEDMIHSGSCPASDVKPTSFLTGGCLGFQTRRKGIEQSSSESRRGCFLLSYLLTSTRSTRLPGGAQARFSSQEPPALLRPMKREVANQRTSPKDYGHDPRWIMSGEAMFPLAPSPRTGNAPTFRAMQKSLLRRDMAIDGYYECGSRQRYALPFAAMRHVSWRRLWEGAVAETLGLRGKAKCDPGRAMLERSLCVLNVRRNLHMALLPH